MRMSALVSNRPYCTYCNKERSFCKGACRKCYDNIRRHGVANWVRPQRKEKLPKAQKASRLVCSFCKNRSVKYKDLCAACIARERRNGTPEYKYGLQPKPCQHCEIHPAICKGLCNSCYSGLRRHGYLPKKTARKLADSRHCAQCKSKGLHAKGLCRKCYERNRYKRKVLGREDQP